jgi:RNase adaptor protein for sRNA GlmZ degradation
MEVWKKVLDSNEKFEVSNFGRVRRSYKNHKRVLKCGYNSFGYKHVGVNYTLKIVHRLIAVAFIPNPENKPCVNHKNGIKDDNRVENLEWTTYLENNLHAIETGLRSKNPNKPFW